MLGYWCVLLLVLPVPSSPFILEGSDTSYARFSRWNVNTTLSFEFTSNQPDGLILYTDDAGKTDFFELKLVEGILRLRFNLLNQGTQLINIGNHLNDGLWHRVELAVTVWNVLVTVDGFVSERRNVGSGGGGGRNEGFADNVQVQLGSGVFVGGLPSYFNSRLYELTLASVVFEPRFRGAVRNLVYGAVSGGGIGASSVVKPQEIVESKGLISGSATSEACERHDPCLHGGFCISTDSGPVCDCKHIDFEGVNCEVEKSPTSATFHGKEYIGYDFRESGGHQPIISQLDEISLYFKTTNKNRKGLPTLLFYSGDGVDYIALTLRSGQLMLSINLGSGPLDTKLHPDHLRFDDGEWHSVRVHRKIQEMSRSTSLCHITASVDGIHFDRWTLAGSFTLLSSNRVTVAGYDTLRPLNGIRGVSNFMGCLKKVEYRADTLRLNILELARSGNRLVTISGGRLVFACQDAIDDFETGVSGSSIGGFLVVENNEPPPLPPHYQQPPIPFSPHSSNQPQHQDAPITFTQPQNSYLVIPPYHNVSTHSTQISLKLRTTEPNGLVLYSAHSPHNLIAIELLEGHVILSLQASQSSPTTRIQATSTRIHDGEWHTIKLIRNGRSGSVTVDDLTTDFNMKSEARNLFIGSVYLGNVPSQIGDERIWNIGLGYGFVGCMKNVYIEHTLVDLVRLANSQDIGGIRPYCQVGSAGECVSNPCLNNGKCTDGWGRFVCECGFVGFEGGVCQVDAPYLDLSDASVYEFTNRSVAPGSPLSTRLFTPTQAQDIRFRFKTLNPNAVLLSISGHDSDFIEVRITSGGAGGGRLRVRVRLSDNEKTLSVGHSTSPFSDNNWHVFQFTRRGQELRVFVDDLPPVSNSLATRTTPTLNTVKYSISSLTSPFTGSIQSLTINNVELLSALKLKRLKPASTVATPSIRSIKSINNPIQFLPRKTSKGPAHITLPQLKAYSTLRLRFKFKTQTANGVLFYNGAGSSSDYVAVVINDFKLVFSMGFGETSSSVEVISNRLKLDSWVDVDVMWDGGTTVAMAVDQYVFENEITRGDVSYDNLVLKLNGVLYVGGGVSDGVSSYSRVRGETGNADLFVGCIANVDVGGEGVTFEGGGGAHGVVHGCGGSDGVLEPYNPLSVTCTTDTCDNGGMCFQEVDGVVACDCEMTSYAGPTCSLESTSYEFSSSSSMSSPQQPNLYSRTPSSRGHSRPGVIQFTYLQNREPTTLHDNIAFGVITTSSDAVILRIESVKTTDYLEVELISGKLRVTYNMYLNKDHTIGEVTRQLNDNAYHVVRFNRNGPNATLQIDNSDIITTYPDNHKENLFNSIGVITVGGRVKELKREITIVRGFKGIISGLVINGVHILDMTLNGDPRVRVYGDVRNVRGITGGREHHTPRVNVYPPAPRNRERQRGNNQAEYVYNTGEFQRAPPASSSSTTLSDDLISSGDSHRCLVTDDEDNEDCAGGLPSGYTDDIITPVYVPTTRVTTTITSTKSNQDSMYFPCAGDDEDCVEYGSGILIEGTHPGTPRSHGTSSSSSTTLTSTSSQGASTSTEYSPPYTTSTEYHTPQWSSEHSPYPVDPHHHHTHTHSSSTTTEQDQTSSTSTSTTTRFTPPHPPSPPPYINKGGNLFDFDHNQNRATPSSTSTVSTIEKKKSFNETVYFADSGDSTLIIIIIIAVLMIIIVSILIIFFMCKRRDDPIYKIEQQGAVVPQAGAPPPTSVIGTGAGVQQVAGVRFDATATTVQGAGMMGGQQRPGGPRKTGVKEWYV